MRRKATAEEKQAMKLLAGERNCPHCKRGYAVDTNHTPLGVFKTCRWCTYITHTDDKGAVTEYLPPVPDTPFDIVPGVRHSKNRHPKRVHIRRDDNSTVYCGLKLRPQMMVAKDASNQAPNPCSRCASRYQRHEERKRKMAPSVIPPDLVPVPGHPGYFARRDGTVWSMMPVGSQAAKDAKLRQLALMPLKHGYSMVSMNRAGKNGKRLLHHVMLETFVGPRPPGAVCRHLDGNPANNTPENLAWGTQLENVGDTKRHGRQHHGTRTGNARLTDDKVRRIRELYATGHYSLLTVGEMFGVHYMTVHAVVKRQTWKHVV